MTAATEEWWWELFIVNNVFRMNKCFWLNINYPNSSHIYRCYPGIFRSTLAFGTLQCYFLCFFWCHWPPLIHCSYWANTMLQTYFPVQREIWGPKICPRKFYCHFALLNSSKQLQAQRERTVLISTTQRKSVRMLSKRLLETRRHK